MGAIMNWAQAARNSGARLGPVDAIFAGLDYKQGKDEGEDDLRALGGAGASAAGSWAGAVSGGTTGAAIGTALGGPVGTVIGGAIGTIGGGLGGGNAANWAFDRADEFVRGSQGKAKAQSAPQIQESNSLGPLAVGAGIIGAGVAATQILRGKKMPFRLDPVETFRAMKAGGAGLQESLGVASRAGLKQGGEILESVAKNPAARAGAILVGGVWVNAQTGNPIGGAMDMASGGATDFKANENDQLGYAHNQRQIDDQIKAANGGISATDTDSIMGKYSSLIEKMEASQDPNGYLQKSMRAADEQGNMLMENRGYRVGDYVMQQELAKGAFDQSNSMAAKAADGYWQNRAANNQTVAGMFRR